MYAVGVNGFGADDAVEILRSGLYLWGGQSQGWGREGLGAQDRNEPFGQNRGRWFCSPPFGVSVVDEYVSVAPYNGRSYLVGGFSYQLVLDEHHRLWRQGIKPPAEAPTITGAPGDTNIAYLSWWDELTQERSPLSKGNPIGDATPRTWDDLPFRPPDDVYVGDEVADINGVPFIASQPLGGRLRQMRPGDRIAFESLGATRFTQVTHPVLDGWLVEQNVIGAFSTGSNLIVAALTRPTHLELWLAFAGDLPRLAMRVPIGTTSVTESKGIADLGEAFITQFQRFPRCTMNAVYHDRQIMAGDLDNPDTVYLSALFQPERFEGLSFRTRDGRAITGLLSTRDFCMVFTRHGAYLLQGYTDTDYTMTPVDQSIGSVGHHCNVLVHGDPFVWSEKGPYTYNGGWHPLSPENRWVPPDNGRKMVATEDPYFQTYIVSNVHKASKAIGEPFHSYDESGILGEQDIVDTAKFFGVMDYTLVAPETGGAMQPSRFGWDRGLVATATFLEGDPIYSLDEDVFMKYIRNRYGRGNLYRIGGDKLTSDQQVVYTANDWANNVWSFKVSGMLLPGAVQQLNLSPEEDAEIVTPFDYLGDGGGYSEEQKQIKRLWYFMRMTAGSVSLYMAPGPGYWGSRIYPAVASPIQFDVAFTASGEYRGGVVEAPHADVIMPVLPDYLSGRGMWLHVRGAFFYFSGFAVEAIWGSEVVHPLP